MAIAIPTQLANLQAKEKAVWHFVTSPYLRICDPGAQELTPAETMRRELLDKFCELEDICYQNYFMETSDLLLTPQDDWIPLFNQVNELMEQFQDRQELMTALYEWKNAYQIYRDWVVNCGHSRSMLGYMWFDDEDADADADADAY